MTLGRTVAVIPAKAESKRLPGKNLMPFAGDRSLVARKVRQLLAVDAIDEVVVGTDSDEITEHAKVAGAHVVRRDAYHCDESRCPANDMIRNLAAMVEADTVVWAHCTNPLVGSQWYAQALREYDACTATGVYDSLCSVRREKRHAWMGHSPINFDPWGERHQLAVDLPAVAHQDGAIFIQPHRQMLDNAYFYGRNPVLFDLPWHVGIDIDTPSDLMFARAIHGTHTIEAVTA